MNESDKLICSTNEELLVGVVMKLTGGSANPAVVRGQIERIKAENPYKHRDDPFISPGEYCTKDLAKIIFDDQPKTSGVKE